MSVRTPTVLILGAGSSVHCDYPLGMQLISNIVNDQRNGKGIPIPSDWNQSEVDKFVTRLSRSGHYSIDAFLETAPDETRIGKYLIAHCLKQREDVNRLFPPHASGWYQYLFNRLLGSDRSPFFENNLTIVTFNYDRSLEAYLFYALMARFKMSEADATFELERIPIIHVHGILGPFPQFPYEKTSDVTAVRSVSESINIIHEIRDTPSEFCTDDFRKAHDAIAAASKVIFLGFGFHSDNIRRLQVDWSGVAERKVYSTFWDMAPHEYKDLIDRLGVYGFSSLLLPNTGGHACDGFFRHVTKLE